MSPEARAHYNAYHKSWYHANKHRIPRLAPERVSWKKMRQRCNDPKSNRYQYYGGRGIKVFYESYQEFIKDVGLRPGIGYSIDRIDPNGHYTVGNCRWATAQQQRLNRRKLWD